MNVIQLDLYRSKESLHDIKVNKLLIAIENMVEKQKKMMETFGKNR